MEAYLEKKSVFHPLANIVAKFSHALCVTGPSLRQVPSMMKHSQTGFDKSAAVFTLLFDALSLTVGILVEGRCGSPALGERRPTA